MTDTYLAGLAAIVEVDPVFMDDVIELRDRVAAGTFGTSPSRRELRNPVAATSAFPRVAERRSFVNRATVRAVKKEKGYAERRTIARAHAKRLAAMTKDGFRWEKQAT
jgi:hypothetical protein